MSGTVTGLRPYGAFLELENGVAGLLHISQISSDRVDNLEQLLSVGQKCKVMILEHDKVSGRVALSTKTLEANPGDMLRDSNAVFETKVLEVNKGGAVCDVFGLKGFLPGSHFTTLPDQSIVGQTIKASTFRNENMVNSVMNI